MIKSTAVAMRGILRFNPLKPIKHGECGFGTWVALYKWAWENMIERRGGLARVLFEKPIGRHGALVGRLISCANDDCFASGVYRARNP